MEKRKEVDKNNLMLYFYEGEDCDYEEGLPVGLKSYLPFSVKLVIFIDTLVVMQAYMH